MNKTKNIKIIQWNCRGFNGDKRNQLDIILQEEKNAPIVCLQETNYNFEYAPTKKGFNFFFKNTTGGARAHGGVMTIIKEGINCNEISLNTKILAVAIKVDFPFEVVICNVYRQPKCKVEKKEWENLIEQLGNDFILLGEINAKAELWGEKKECKDGKNLREIIENLDLVVLNNGDKTHLNYGTKTLTTPDITIVTRSLTNYLKWHVKNDLHCSDHYPIIITTNTKLHEETRKKWKTKEARWSKFRKLLTFNNKENLKFMEINEHEKAIRQTILNAAEKSIPKTTGRRASKYAPWWTKEIEEKLKEKQTALNCFRLRGKTEDFNKFTNLQRKLTQIIKKEKEKSWERFITESKDETTSNLFNKANKLKGKYKTNSVITLKINNKITTNHTEIAEKLSLTFNEITKIANYPEKTRNEIDAEMKNPLKITADNNEHYNLDFTLREMEIALKACKGTSPGPDEINYSMLQNLTQETAEIILELYNRIWNQNAFPENWRKSLAIPIPKPGKNPVEPENLRTIQLTNTICKLFERMINKRLMGWLENNNLINKNQSGFRKGRRTTDGLIKLENMVTEAWEKGEETLVVSFDIHKAYDTTRRQKIIEELTKYGLKGNIMKFLLNFLKDRKVTTLIGNTKSRERVQETGLPQGSVISVTLFLVATNNMLQEYQESNVQKILYADDLAFVLQGKDRKQMMKDMQLEIDRVTESASQMGHKFSNDKTVGMWFTRKRKTIRTPKLTCNNKNIEMVTEHRMLGVTFDSKLTWATHINNTKQIALKRLNVMKMLSGYKVGLKYDQLLTLHETIVLSTLDYGSVLYGGGAKTHLQKLDALHHKGVRMALGLFQTTPVESLLAEAGFLPLDMRRKLQALNYAATIIGNKNHPENNTLSRKYRKTSRQKGKTSFFDRTVDAMKKFEIDPTKIEQTERYQTWTEDKIKFDMELANSNKTNTDKIIMKAVTQEKINKYNQLTHIYTDGSKMEGRIGWGFKSNQYEKCGRISSEGTVFEAELKAILEAVKWAVEEEKENFLILTDSLSGIQEIQNNRNNSASVKNIREKIRGTTKSFTFLWIPSHIGVEGNESADLLAKKGGKKLEVEENIQVRDFKRKIKEKVWEEWEKRLEKNVVFCLRGTSRRNKKLKKEGRKETRNFMRIRTGHTRKTHVHIIKGEPKPRCECGNIIDTNHILNCENKETLRKILYIDYHTVLMGDSIENTRKISAYLKLCKMSNEI